MGSSQVTPTSDDHATRFADKETIVSPTLTGIGKMPASPGEPSPPLRPEAGVDGARASLDPGCVLMQRFVIQRLLGRGGMGEVYEAEDLRLNRARVAVKAIRPEYTWHPEMRHRFQHEVLLARSISHPNVCPVYEMFCSLGPNGEIWFLTMKLLSGETLTERLERTGRLRVEEGLRFGREIASALDCAHQNEVIHRDLKPGNIFLDTHFSGIRAVVTDFGLARNWSEEPWQSDAGRVVGTPAYIAPEVLGGGVASPKSDVFSFGVVLHEMLLGEKPQDARAHQDQGGAEEAKRRRLRAVIARCLLEDPDSRFPSAGAAMHALDAAWMGHAHAVTRREMLFAGFTTLAAGTVAEWKGRDWLDVEDLLQPIPRPRRVAVLPGAPGASARDASLLNGVMESIGTELTRAESSERDLQVFSPQSIAAQGVSESEILGTFGANLAISASLARIRDAIQLTLHLRSTGTGKSIRSARLSHPLDALYSLPAMATEKAAALLDIRRKDLASRSEIGSTKDGNAFAAYTRAQDLLKSFNLPDIEKAIEELQKAVDIDPQFARAWAMLGLSYKFRYSNTNDPGALDQAQRDCEKAIRLTPRLAGGYTSRAQVEEARGQFDAALKDLDRARRLDPDDVETQLMLAQTYVAKGRLESADRIYKQVLEERPNRWAALNDWGFVYYKRADYARAGQLFREATNVSPRASAPWENLAGVYLQTEKLDDAQHALTEALARFPSSDAYSNRGTAFFWAGQYREAWNDYQKAAGLSPGSHVVWGNLGDAETALGHRKEAVAAWQKAAALAQRQLDVNPKDADTITDLALLTAKLGGANASLLLLKRADALSNADADRKFREACTYELAGQRDMALRLLSESLKSGYSHIDVKHAPELEALRKDPRFGKLGVS